MPVISGRSSTSPSATIRRARRSRPGCSRRASLRSPSRTRPPSPVALGGSGTVDVNIQNTGLLYGTYTKATGGIDGNRDVPIRIYNNYVRWMWAYVQYLGKDKDGNDVNLSLNPNASWPDTKYSKSLSVLPQISTVLGVPLWDTNTVDVTLTFPPDAHTARLLYSGLGNDAYGGGWSQYFPAGAYAGRIAPHGRSAVPGPVHRHRDHWPDPVRVDHRHGHRGDLGHGAQVRRTGRRPAGSGLRGDAAGDYQCDPLDDRRGADRCRRHGRGDHRGSRGSGSGNNLWSILLGFGTVIPKLLFGPGMGLLWAEIATAILATEVAEKVVQAIPIIGEALAIVQAIGDAATLAEVAGETATSPWVIANAVTLSYQTDITISPDPNGDGGGWPVTAVKWELSPLIDGAATQSPITADMNVGGRVGNEALKLSPTAPFGGETIQWSIVILDSAGHQVGTGVSPKYPNNDPNNPASSVSFAITEIPAPIHADTVFQARRTPSSTATRPAASPGAMTRPRRRPPTPPSPRLGLPSSRSPAPP